MSEKNIMIVDTVEALEKRIEEVREAQRIFSTYSQEQVDKIFAAAALAANKARIPLAKQAVAETGMGIVEDKVIKNHYASEYIYNAYKDTKTCGVIEEDSAYGIKRIAEPIGAGLSGCHAAKRAGDGDCSGAGRRAGILCKYRTGKRLH